MNEERTIGLLIVHGIGDQNPGETSDKLMDGFRAVYGDKLQIERDGKNLPTELKLKERKVKLYEVFWADLLSGDKVAKTFNWAEFQALAWLPRLNQKAGLLPDRYYKKYKSLMWTMLLVPFTGILWLAYKGANVLADKGKYSKADQIFDDVVGDVTNYMASVGRIQLQNGRGDLLNVANKIHQRFYAQLSKADKECDEIQILAHSLGTVVTYHALTGLLLDINNQPEAREGIQPIEKLKRLYTIGCPLGKIWFFWPFSVRTELINEIVVDHDNTLLLSTNGSATSNFKWDNFYHKFDLVSGKLKRFSHWFNFELHSLKGGGGIIRSHVIYERSPQFLEVITQGLFGKSSRLEVSKWSRFTDRFISGLELFILPSSIVVLTMIGTAFALFLFFLAGAFFADLASEEFGPQIGDALGIIFTAGLIVAMLLAWYFNTRNVAKELHSKWTNISAGN